MFPNLVKKIFGSRNDRLIKQYSRTVAQINALEAAIAGLERRAVARQDRRIQAALARTAKRSTPCCRKLSPWCAKPASACSSMRHFDVQLIGGMVLHYGKIAEMRTGEGKTLVATLPAYLNALSGKGVHVVTVNDYLASRDATGWGVCTVSSACPSASTCRRWTHDDKQAAYAADITYGTNNEFGFDYLRDNMVYRPAERVQRGLNYAIVDEVDSILIDEARTPLIISGQADDSVDLYTQHERRWCRKLDRGQEQGGRRAGDYWVDEKSHQVLLSEAGHEHAEATAGAGRPAARGQQPLRSRPTSRWCTTCTPRCAPIRCSTATSTTWCRTAKSSSSTNSPAA